MTSGSYMQCLVANGRSYMQGLLANGGYYMKGLLANSGSKPKETDSTSVYKHTSIQ